MTRNPHQTEGPADRPQDDVSPPVIWAKLVLGRPDSGDAIPVFAPEEDRAGASDSADEPPSPVAPSP